MSLSFQCILHYIATRSLSSCLPRPGIGKMYAPLINIHIVWCIGLNNLERNCIQNCIEKGIKAKFFIEITLLCNHSIYRHVGGFLRTMHHFSISKPVELGLNTAVAVKSVLFSENWRNLAGSFPDSTADMLCTFGGCLYLGFHQKYQTVPHGEHESAIM